MTTEPKTPTNAVVETVAERTGRSVSDLPPIYDVIDGDALNQLLAAARENDATVTVQFTYAGFRVLVTESGAVRLSPTGSGE